MTRIIAWFEKRPTPMGFLKLVGLATVIQIVWLVVLIAVFVTFGWLPERNEETREFSRQVMRTDPVVASALLLFAVVLVEEVLSRGPLVACLYVYQWRKDIGAPVLLIALVISSVAFGAAHISNLKTDDGIIGPLVFSLLNQGMAGIFYGALLFKCCGLQLRYAGIAFASVVLMHWGWDMSILAIARYA